MVVCATSKRVIAGSSRWLCCAVYGVVLLGKALHPYIKYELSRLGSKRVPGEIKEPVVVGFLVGPRRLSVCDQFCAPRLVAYTNIASFYSPSSVAF